MSNVTSRPMSGSQVITQAASTLPWRLGGLGAMIAGFALWLIGARYTVLGGPQVVSMALAPFHIDFAPALPDGWGLFFLTITVGAIVSSVEFGCRPRRSFFARSIALGIAAVVLWLLFNGGDWLSTFVGVTTPTDDAWALTLWVAKTPAAAIPWTTFLTYCPELLMIAGGRWIVTGRF